MKVSAFTIVRNVRKYNYPAVESIRSILPLCDEFIINVGDSDDDTLELIESVGDPKIKILQNVWDFSEGKGIVLDRQTEIAMAECTGDWVFYLQADEIIHEKDVLFLRKTMEEYLHDESIDALRLNWLNFFGSYYRYRIDHGWVQKQDRILKNPKDLIAVGGAYGFARKDGEPLKRKKTRALLYHYGWVQSPSVMTQRRVNAENIGYIELTEDQRKEDYKYGDLNRFPLYFGSHPAVMKEVIDAHPLTKEEKEFKRKKYWWYPPQIFNIRYKTGRRIKKKIDWY
jgi:glycosyltransferase involved in cell wall biosynthesis